MRLASLTRPELIFPDLPSGTAGGRDAVLRALAERVAAQGPVLDPAELFQKLRERELLGSTAIGSGIAIPHCKLAGLDHGIVAVGVAPGGVDFGAADGQPVRLFFLVLSPSAAPGEHLQVLATVSRWIRAAGSTGSADRILELREPEAVQRFLQEEGL